MARGTRKSANFRPILIGEPGVKYRQEEHYFSLVLKAVHVPGKVLNTSKFAPVVWVQVKQNYIGDQNKLGGFFPTNDDGAPEFARADKLHVVDRQLTPRLVYRDELGLDVTLGAIKQKDYLSDALKVAADLSKLPAVGFLSAAAPLLDSANPVPQVAETITEGLDRLLDQNGLQSLGEVRQTLRAPVMSGLYAFTDSHAKQENLSFDTSTSQLMTSKGPMKSAYAVVEFRCEEFRPDWSALPDLNAAWRRIQEDAHTGDISGAMEHFRVTALTSPDLVPADAERIINAAKRKFAAFMTGEESFFFETVSGLGDALASFVNGSEIAEASDDSGEESVIMAAGVSAVAGRAATAGVPVGAFARALELVLEHEGGFVDHPDDPGGATNRGVTQKTYDRYRDKLGLARRTVRNITDSEIEEIYFAGYWQPARCPEMPSEALAILMFDAAVNHGPRRAIKLLQQASGVPASSVDGRWGPQSRGYMMKAAADIGGLVDRCLLKREAFYHTIVRANPALNSFIRGWLNRIANLRSHLNPFLIAAGVIDDTESALMTMDGELDQLVAASTDFDGWAPMSTSSTPPEPANDEAADPGVEELFSEDVPAPTSAPGDIDEPEPTTAVEAPPKTNGAHAGDGGAALDGSGGAKTGGIAGLVARNGVEAPK
ncbi:MAG: glycosyl hydrolase 108 family protein [Pseudomonadota bacterium]